MLAIAEVNVENRGKMKYNHNTGSGSHVRVMTDHQALDEDHEVAFNEIDLFRVTYTNDKGDWVNDAAEEDYNLLCNMLIAPDVEVDGVVQPRLTEVDIIEKVRGYRSGYIKGLRAGPTHNRKSIHVATRLRASQDQIVTQLVEENKELNEKLHDLYCDVANIKTMFMSFTQTLSNQ